jgi:hypothetical protein
MSRTAVYVEAGGKRTFACALDWPGWCRSGKSEEQALEALAAAAPRYAVAVKVAGLEPPAGALSDLKVVERLPGTKTTDFGAPDAKSASDSEPLSTKRAERLAALVAAAWNVFDRVVKGAPSELRKGPRGGGRDRDKIVAHVLGAESAYAAKIGLRLLEPAAADLAAVSAFREAILETLRDPSAGRTDGKGWPLPYAARRIAWHALDHAWEIEDRSGGN